VYMHRARLIAFLFVIILTIFNYFFAIKIISLFDLGEEVIYFASRYIYLSLCYVMVDVMFSVNFRYLNIIGKSYVNLIVLLITICIHPLWCLIFINHLDLDALGCGIAMLISQALNTIITTLYVHIANPCPESYFFLNKDCFIGWWEYTKFTLPSVFLLCAEWWAFEVQAIIAINISKLDYAVHILISAIAGIMVASSIGFGMAMTIVVGKYITFNLKSTKKTATVCFFFGNVVSFLISLIPLFMGKSLLWLFVDEKTAEDIVEKGAPLVYIIVVNQIFDMSQTLLASVYRGLGKQLMASVVAFVTFYIVQTGFSILFGIVFKHGVLGMWIGMMFGSFGAFTTYLVMLKCLDLEAIRVETLKRLEEDKNQLGNEAVNEPLRKSDL